MMVKKKKKKKKNKNKKKTKARTKAKTKVRKNIGIYGILDPRISKNVKTPLI